MMDHRTIYDQLFAFYDGEVTGAARRDIEEHLGSCLECRALLAQWKQLAGVCFRAPAVPVSDAVVQRVMRRIATHPPRVAGAPRWILESAWLVPALGLVGIFLLMVGEPMQRAVSIDALLLSNGREPATMPQALVGEQANPDDVLGLMMEEGS